MQLQFSYHGQQVGVSQSVRGNKKTRLLRGTRSYSCGRKFIRLSIESYKSSNQYGGGIGFKDAGFWVDQKGRGRRSGSMTGGEAQSVGGNYKSYPVSRIAREERAEGGKRRVFFEKTTSLGRIDVGFAIRVVLGLDDGAGGGEEGGVGGGGRYIIKIKIHSSGEIEYFVETHLCKLCVILRSRVLRVVCPH